MKRIIKLSLVFLLVLCFSSCACYHCPRVYKDRSIPTGISVPLKKNTKQNKYGPKKPYYGKSEKLTELLRW